MVDDECPFCEERDMVPFDADDLTFLIDQRPNLYVVLQSPETAEDAADYVEVAEFPAQAQAKSCVDEAKRRLSGQLQGSEATQHLLHIKPFVWASGGENADAVNALAVAGISETNREFAGVVLGLGDAPR